MNEEFFNEPTSGSDSSEPIAISSAGVSFDDLDEVETRVAEKEEKASKDKKQSDADKDIAKKKEVSGRDNEDDANNVGKKKPEAKEKPTKDDKKQSEDKATEPQTKDETKTEYKSKIVKAKAGDTEVEYDENAVIAVKVDGQVEEVSIGTLRNEYSGKKATERRFSEINEEKKGLESFKTERDQLVKHVTDFREMVNKGDTLEALNFLVDLAGGDRHNFNKSLRDLMIPKVQEWMEKSDEEREAIDAQSKAQYLEQELQSYKDQATETQELATFRKHIDEVRNSTGIEEDAFYEAQSSLFEAVDDGSLKLGKNDITPEYICDYINAKTRIAEASDVIESIDSSLFEDGEFTKGVYNIYTSNPEFSKADLKEIILGSSGNDDEVQELNEKVGTTGGKKPRKVESSREEAPEFFDDFNDSYL